MIADIWTVARKELSEMLVQGDARGRSKIGLLIFLFVFGIMIPLQNGRDWITSPVSVIAWGWLPFLMVSGVVADLFAGERERHTLEALLATRLSDRAILFGKLFAALAYGCLLTWVVVLVSLVTVNIAFGHGELLLFPWELAVGIVVFSILVAGFSASIGVLVSLRAASVRQAQQWMSAGMFIVFVPLMLLQFVPQETLKNIGHTLETVNPLQVAVGLAIGLLLVEIVLIAIAMRLFQRSKLILD
jgi:ABC-2 type transport system permease protein